MSEQTKCVDRVAEEWAGRKLDLECMLRPSDLADRYYEQFSNYALSFDYVSPYTFIDQDEGYFRYQMSWGGPSDEIRFYADSDLQCYKAEYWFMDWVDGAKLDVTGTVADDVFEFFRDVGTLQSVYDEAMDGWEPPSDGYDSEDEESE